MERFRHLGPLSRIALVVAAADLLTKQVALRFFAGEPAVVNGWLRLAVVHNDGGAFGLSVGAYTWQLNVALTLAAIVFVIPVSRELTKVDRAAPRALGLIVGGALGNLTSLLVSRHGVVDFIAVRMGSDVELALNVADLAAYTGLAMILRTGFLIVAAIRKTMRPRVGLVPDLIPSRAPISFAMADREVPRPVFREAEVADDPPHDSGPGVPGNVGPRTPFLRRNATRVLQFPPSRIQQDVADAPPVELPPPGEQLG